MRKRAGNIKYSEDLNLFLDETATFETWSEQQLRLETNERNAEIAAACQRYNCTKNELAYDSYYGWHKWNR